MSRHPSSWPARAERAVLERIGGIEPPAATPSPNYQLAFQVRRLNARLSQLSPEQQADLLPAWGEDWEALERDRNAAPDWNAELTLIDKWARSWTRRVEAIR